MNLLRRTFIFHGIFCLIVMLARIRAYLTNALLVILQVSPTGCGVTTLYFAYLENRSEIDFCGRMNPLMQTVSGSYVYSYSISSLSRDLRDVK